MTPPQLARLACEWECTARKIGNVHPRAAFADMSHTDFMASATCFEAVEIRGDHIGPTIRELVIATRRMVHVNTNLGIILLLGPLLHVRSRPITVEAIQSLLSLQTVADTADIFEAIRLAKPTGLGRSAVQDINDIPTMSPVEVMRLAADRDDIARQYMTDYLDVIYMIAPMLAEWYKNSGSIEYAIIKTQLKLLSRYPDSHIRRKYGTPTADDICIVAERVLRAGGIDTDAGRFAAKQLDGDLRQSDFQRNPGTTADLITAGLFVALANGMIDPLANFPWQTEDWL
jgi:triphosphoribosyl-dephospho-CoA synthase